MFGNSGKDMDVKAVRTGEVGADEINAGLHEYGDERHVTGEPVKLRHHQYGTVFLTEGQGSEQLRTILPLATLHFYEISRRDVLGNGYPLGVDTITINPLFRGANSQVVGRT
jgi:hypothetical protein